MKSPALRSLIWKYARPLVRIVPADVDGVRLHVNPRDEIIGKKAFVRGWYEPLEMAEVRRHARPGTVCVDIGANIGIYSCLMARGVGPSGKVLCFEPSSENFEFLERNTRAFSNCRLEKSAVSDVAGDITLYLSPSHKGDHRIYRPETEVDRTPVVIRSVRLDDYLRDRQIAPGEVTVVKMDTQGAEPRILRGLGERIPEFRNAVFFVEFWPAAYEEQRDIDAVAFMDELFARFVIVDLNYVDGTMTPITGRGQLSDLYRKLLANAQGIGHTTLVLRVRQDG